ncbi:MAG: rhodanese-like domain-containing protein [Gammaproteobacteria bacterium]
MDRIIEFITNHWMLFVALAVVTFLLLQELIGSLTQKFKSISAIVAVTQMNKEETFILDVSEPHEYVKGHIEGAMNIPFAKLNEDLGKLEKYKNSPVIVTCQTGTRSTPACKTLTKSGFTQVYNLIGGMQSWEENKLPIRKSGK